MNRTYYLLLIVLPLYDGALRAEVTVTGTPSASGASSSPSPHHYLRHHHYAQAMMTVQNFGVALNSANNNPMDDFRRNDVAQAAQQMNDAITAVKSDISSGQVSPDEVAQVQQGLATALNNAAGDSKANAAGPAAGGGGITGVEVGAASSSKNAIAGLTATSAPNTAEPLSNGAGNNPEILSLSAGVTAGTAGNSGAGDLIPTAAVIALGAGGNPAVIPSVAGDVLPTGPSEAKLDKKVSLPINSINDLSTSETEKPNVLAKGDTFGIDVRDERSPSHADLEMSKSGKKTLLATAPAKSAVLIRPVLRALRSLAGLSTSEVDTEEHLPNNRRVALLAFFLAIPLFLVFYLLGMSVHARSTKKKRIT
jgi:hypothetical protein